MLLEGDVQQSKHTVKELLSPMHVNKLNRCLFWKIWYFLPPAGAWVTVGDFYWFSALRSSLCGVMSSCSAGSMWGIERESNSSGLWVITPLPVWRGGERKVGVLNGGVRLTRMYSKTMEPRRRSHSGAETFLHVQLSMCVWQRGGTSSRVQLSHRRNCCAVACYPLRNPAMDALGPVEIECNALWDPLNQNVHALHVEPVLISSTRNFEGIF